MRNPPKRLPLWLIGGPSGVGKSHYCPLIARLKNFLWLEFDTPPRDAVADLGLGCVWRAFWACNEKPLVAEFKDRAAEARRDGVIISLPSNCLLPPRVLQAWKRAGGLWVMLWATPERCLNAFLAREERSDRGLDARHWARYSDFLFRRELDARLVETFDPTGKARTASAIAEEIDTLR
jgi:hypothetical protein